LAQSGAYGLYASFGTYAQTPGGSEKRDSVAWVKVDPLRGQVAVTARGSFGFANEDAFFPSVATQNNGTAVYNFTTISASLTPGLVTVAIDISNHPNAAKVVYRSPASFRDINNPTAPTVRWGDYSAIVPDPAADGLYWGTGETVRSDSQWSTRVFGYTTS